MMAPRQRIEVTHKTPTAPFTCFNNHSLGQGSQARVVLGTNSTGQRVAIKMYNKFSNYSQGLQEAAAMSKLAGVSNIPKFYSCVEDTTHLYLMLEYVGGMDLCAYIKAYRGRVSEVCAKRLMWQVFTALKACHGASLVHRDIRLENILLDASETRAYLIDFGLCADVSQNKRLTGQCGALEYSAPEMFKSKPYDATKCDVWSCGVVLYALLCGKLPFVDTDKAQLVQKISTSSLSFPPHVSSTYQHLVTWMLEKSPENRPTISEILLHPWLSTKLPVLPFTLRRQENSLAAAAPSSKGLGDDYKALFLSAANEEDDLLELSALVSGDLVV